VYSCAIRNKLKNNLLKEYELDMKNEKAEEGKIKKYIFVNYFK
jgi:hypothetical protein